MITIGGIGDILQAVQNDEMTIVTHQNVQAITDFANKLGKNWTVTDKFPEGGEIAPRRFFPDFQVKRRKVIGIHPVGSKFSNDFWLKQGQPLKIIPPEFVKQLIRDDAHYFIFGTQGELEPYEEVLVDYDNITYINMPIYDALSYVELCDLMICIDSSIKTYAGIRRIPTILLLGDYDDKFRDENFVDPYDFRVIRFRFMDKDTLYKIKEVEDEVFPKDS
jgi:hypothetical protein